MRLEGLGELVELLKLVPGGARLVPCVLLLRDVLPQLDRSAFSGLEGRCSADELWVRLALQLGEKKARAAVKCLRTALKLYDAFAEDHPEALLAAAVALNSLGIPGVSVADLELVTSSRCVRELAERYGKR
jgi:hypothetical protein